MAFHWKKKNAESKPLQHPDRTSDSHMLSSVLASCSEFYCRYLGPLFRSTYRVCRLTVRDNGEGILPEVMDKIFVPFFTTKPSGSGIGLSLCKQIMNLHGGTITVSSEISKGSCFTLMFP